jgi:predicted acylesterase/phospholipase RssA
VPQDTFYKTLPKAITFVDGVFKGGGTAGVAYIGSLMALARHGVWFQRTAGTSAGAITAAIIAAGYDANEIDFLGAPGAVRSGAPNNLPADAKPFDYRSFMDLPSANDLTLQSRRNNLIYHAIHGPTLQELLRLPINLPGLEPFITQIVNQVLGVIPTEVGPFKVKVGPYKIKKKFPQPVGTVTLSTGKIEEEVGPFKIPMSTIKPLVRQAIEGVLQAYPRFVKLADTALLPTEELRHAFADAVMSTLLLTNPFLVMYLNFLGDGGMFTGDVFLRTIRGILEAKVGRSPVRFADLPMEFACTACDTTTQELKAYSTITTPDMEVAEAVRRSMSIPFFFEPRRSDGHEICDGGVVDNFPVGFFLATANGFFDNSADDMARVKLGFAPGVSAGFGPPMEAEAMLKELLPLGFAVPFDTVEVTSLGRLVNTAVSNMQDSPLLEAMLREFKNVAKYYEVTAGIENHKATDFNITPAKFKKMTRKGWDGAVARMQEAVADGNLVLDPPLDPTNPY